MGYDHVISFEHEDGILPVDESLQKAFAVLKEVVMTEKPGEMYWA